ncbi:hypothetical protein LTR09_007733 [Extremus antarcticus]|uniref:Uncharacterized protein n=1 Tax=Extremus antarcticus TaxID=702011 RepID=A0AAJ0G7E0_9PEZI|nr:hypothetical protein LTR09_007733 [Extremus antarcticus]
MSELLIALRQIPTQTFNHDQQTYSTPHIKDQYHNNDLRHPPRDHHDHPANANEEQYLEYVYYERRDKAREGLFADRPAPMVFSDNVQTGGTGYGTMGEH